MRSPRGPRLFPICGREPASHQRVRLCSVPGTRNPEGPPDPGDFDSQTPMDYNRHYAISMMDETHSALYRRISRLRWQVAILALILVFVHQYIEHRWLFFLSRWQHFWTQVAFYGLVGPILAWLALSSIRRQVGQTEQSEKELRAANVALGESNRRLEFLIEAERSLAKPHDEEELIGRMLTLPTMVLPTLGSSLIRFDGSGQPLPAVHHGDLPPEAFRQWALHLSSPGSQEACKACQSHWSSQYAPCPLLDDVPGGMAVRNVHCLPLKAHGKEIGVLNIYLDDPGRPTEAEAVLLEAMANGMSLVLANHTMRSRELATLSQLQRLDQHRALEEQLQEVLNQTVKGLDADGGAIMVEDRESTDLDLLASVGDVSWDHSTKEMFFGLASSVRTTDGAITLHEFDHSGDPGQKLNSMIIAPLRIEDRWTGSLVLWSEKAKAFVRRQMNVIEALASQIALLIENQRLYREVEYKAGLAERTRLAREIHDGLAQTLGYLKLRTAQIINWMQSGSGERAEDALIELRQQLDDAYVDAREAIDGLSIDMTNGDFESLLKDIYGEFRALAGIPIQAGPTPEIEFAPEVQLQLLRILQEALGNIRKHASATRAAVEWEVDHHWVTLRIEDDGCGFEPDEVAPISRHGLRIMRERAELLGADFRLISGSGQGTEIQIRLPAEGGSYEEQSG